jgi:hypothetical protein
MKQTNDMLACKAFTATNLFAATFFGEDDLPYNS